jgi:cysteinyl-tRNA synthetase
MDDVFNTPAALAVMFDLATEINRTRSVELARCMKSLGHVLGVLQQSPRGYLQGDRGDDVSAIERLIEERDTWRERALAEPNRINAALLDMATPSTVPTTKKETPHDR